jgi:IS5 family transposase
LATNKLHTKLDRDYGPIRELETTTASVHDSQVDRSTEGEVVYRVKGTRVRRRTALRQRRSARRGVIPSPHLSIWDQLRNRRIAKKRAPAERQYAVVKCVFKAGHVLVTTVERVGIKMLFTAFGYKLYQLHTLKKLEKLGGGKKEPV